MNEKHREIAEDLFNKVAMAMTEQGMTVPVFVLILPGDQVYPVIIQSDQEYDVQGYSALVHDIAGQMDAIAIMLVCEQFKVSKQQSDPALKDLLDGKIRASQHPDRKEYLTLMYLDEHNVCESIIAEIHKDPAGTRFTRDFKWIDEAVTNILVPWK